jgi:type IV pilus assembly protein PilY1
MTNSSPGLKTRLKSSVALLAVLSSASAFAGLTDISNGPLATSSTTNVKPNIMFILDDSGSMGWTHLPDATRNFRGDYGYVSARCNPAFYSPAITYVPPKKSDGTSYPDVSFTAAPYNGFNASAIDPTSGNAVINLSSKFKAWDWITGDNDAGDYSEPAEQGAYYYNYTGAQTNKIYTNTASTFYKECNSPIGSSPGSSVFTKVNVATGTAAEKQNFANWFSYYRIRMNMMKTAAGRAFYTLSDKYRVGFTTINYTGTSDSDSRFVTIGDFDATKKSTWFSKLYGASPSSGTPLRPALSKVGRIFAGKVGTNPIQYSCQQNFALLSTDGYYNNSLGYKEDGSTLVGDRDHDDPRPYYDGNAGINTKVIKTVNKAYAVSGSFPSNTCSSSKKRLQTTTTTIERTIVTNNGLVISDNDPGTTSVSVSYGSCVSPAPSKPADTSVTTETLTTDGTTTIADSLADVAAYYYETDLRTTSCNTGVAGADVCENNVPKGPKDTAQHQHMTTFTLGLGIDGYMDYTEDYESGGSADYNSILQGTINWPKPTDYDPTAVDDLWHAAVNGRGTYFSAKNPDALVSGIGKALAGINSIKGAGAAAATSNLEPVAGDNFAYIANYRTVEWTGDLQARTIDLASGEFSTTNAWSAQDRLDLMADVATDTRKIYAWSGSGATKLKEFKPSNFTAGEKSSWFSPTSLSQYGLLSTAQQGNATADALINFLRGQSGFEARGSNPIDNRIFRQRAHILGDVINGKPVYVGRPPFKYLDGGYQSFKASLSSRSKVVYLAANDGMLHALDALTGDEKWAYVPSMVMPNLSRLADTNYFNNHRYYVDGSPKVGDVCPNTGGCSSNQWKTVLVGGLNAGGRGYYALDVTDPENPKALWEFTDSNMGLSYGNPVIAKLLSGQWVVLLSSGYNATNDGHGRLYVLDAYSGSLMRTIVTPDSGSASNPSGLGRIAAYVDDALADNTIMRVYAGDMLGNLWRFDVNDMIAPSGYEATLLAQFTIGSSPQPITTKPELGKVGGKNVVFVGTGRYLGISDITDTAQNSIYGIKDELSATGWGNIRTAGCLVAQTLSSIDTDDSARTLTTNAVDLNSKCGWAVDLNPGNKSIGERVTVDPTLQLGVLAVAANVPTNKVCNVGGYSFLYFIDFRTGSTVTTAPTQAGKIIAGQKVGNALAVGTNTYRLPNKKVITNVTLSTDEHPSFGNPTSPDAGGGGGRRSSWREIMQ